MPALTSYSPYEELLFFQNVAQYGPDFSSLQAISAALKQNQLIRESNNYDAARFSPDALQQLYDKTLNVHKDEDSNRVNGDSSATNGNSPKRKLSTSPPPHVKHESEHFLEQFVDKLYAKFKDETIKDLRRQEEEYRKLEGEIQNLEEKAKSQQANESQTEETQKETADKTFTSPVQSETTDPVAAQLQASLDAANDDAKAAPALPSQNPQNATAQVMPERAQNSPASHQGTSAPRPSSVSGTPQQRHAQPAPLTQQPRGQHSPGAFHRTLPPPSPGRNNFVPIPPAPHGYSQQQPQPQPQPQPHMLPPMHGVQRMPSHEGYSPQHGQGRGSPVPQHPQQPYQSYPPSYQQPPQHGWHSPVPQQYPPNYPPQPYPAQPPPPGRYAQVHTPTQSPYQPFPHTAPGPYPAQQQWRPPPVPYQQYPVSANTTPVPRPSSRTAFLRSGSSTPWKTKSTPTPTAPRARSPSRLEREVSPLSDRGSPPPGSPKRKDPTPKPDHLLVQKPIPRESSATPVPNLSRSQSVMSTTSDAPDLPKKRAVRPGKVKPEPPTTPAPTSTSDSEQQQRSSGRKSRPRGNTSAGRNEPPKTVNTNKRKRDPSSASPAPRARSSSNVQPPPVARSSTQHENRDLVMVSKTFGRTSQLLLNEVTSHKHGGIFAKPLSEREAPGYKSLVYRPQDLKSIKAAINKGSRAAVAAIEELEAKEATAGNDDNEAPPTPTPKVQAATASNSSGPGPIGSGFYLVDATEDLVPPKGIVNFAQLEMELVRMFANAVMFNPLPSSERGFGKSLRLRKRGGELHDLGARRRRDEVVEDEDRSKQERDQSEPVTVGTATSESESSAGSGVDEVGIVADAREMFEDVERLVAGWRELEGEKMGGNGQQQQQQPTPMIANNERQVSVSASSAAGEDGNEGDPAPVGSMLGSVRKRRRVGDH